MKNTVKKICLIVGHIDRDSSVRSVGHCCRVLFVGSAA